MYLDTNSSFSLDEIVKKFEVAFRSYISYEFIQHIKDAKAFNAELVRIGQTFKSSTFLPAARYRSKVLGIQAKYSEVYAQIVSSADAYTKRNYPGDAPYVSTIVDIFVLFFEKCYSTKALLSNFSSSEELLFGVSSYHRLRNTLSHPASSQIFLDDAVSVLKFIRKTSEVLEDDYFWFSSRQELLKKISEFSTKSSQRPVCIENLARIPLQHRKLLCRDDELDRLHDYVLGKEGYQRLAGSVIVYGYGGVGKTALVIEFIYRTLLSIKDSGNSQEIDFILFYSSKEEYLRRMDTSGEVYIENIEQQIASFSEFHTSFCADLGVAGATDAGNKFRRGIVIIDNVENLHDTDKAEIFNFIKATPRNIQYILTSRGEEQCEEKLHVEEYRDLTKGAKFIREYLDFEDFPLLISSDESTELLRASKGNTLILVQSLNAIINGVSTASEIVASLEPVRTKDAKIVADFMYKNTFDNAIRELEKGGYNIRELIVVISLYKEPIDLYSIGKLCEIDIGAASEICQYLSKCLILIKAGEYFRLNEFASNFIFIKMLPDRIELTKIQDRIATHKSRIKAKLRDLDEKTNDNRSIREMMDDWKPKNYIDKVIIAECFTGFKDFYRAVSKGDKGQCERLLREFAENELITDHPYVQYQKAQILSKLKRSGLFRSTQDDLSKSIERAYEDCIESIDFNYPHVRNTRSHGAVLLFFGAHLLDSKEPSRAIRNLEEAKHIIVEPKSKLYFDCRYFLAKAYRSMYEATKDRSYLPLRDEAISEIMRNEALAVQHNFDMQKFRQNFRGALGTPKFQNGISSRH